jgi:hypothetical protein
MKYRAHRLERGRPRIVGHIALVRNCRQREARRAMTPGDASAVRAFYRKALKGRQVWPAGVRVRSSLWFLVAGALIEVGGSATAGIRATPIVLDVDDPHALAQRCWDAGFTVRVNQAPETPVSVFDPFGRRIDLAQRGAEISAGRTA